MLRYSLRDLVWLTLVVALGLGWALSWRNDVLHGSRLKLESGYAVTGLFSLDRDKIRSLKLDVNFDQQGGGTGMIDIDPNYRTHDAFGRVVMTTLMGGPRSEVTYQEVKRKPADPDDGQRSFEIFGHQLNGRLILVVPPYRSSACQLMSLDASGNVKDILVLSPRKIR